VLGYIARLMQFPEQHIWRVDIAIVVGCLVFASMCAPGSLAYASQLLACVGPDGPWRAPRRLSTEARSELVFWTALLQGDGPVLCLLDQAPDAARHVQRVYSDATPWAVAYTLVSRSGEIGEVFLERTEERMEILEAEARAFLEALSSTHGPTAFYLDNQPLCYALQKGRSAHPVVNTVCKAVFVERLLSRRYMSFHWIPSEANWADVPTRPHRLNDVQLRPGELKRVVGKWGVSSPVVDLFAGAQVSQHCALGCSSWSDALVPPSMWRGELLYAFPPPGLIARLVMWLAQWSLAAVAMWCTWWRPTGQPRGARLWSGCKQLQLSLSQQTRIGALWPAICVATSCISMNLWKTTESASWGKLGRAGQRGGRNRTTWLVHSRILRPGVRTAATRGRVPCAAPSCRERRLPQVG